MKFPKRSSDVSRRRAYAPNGRHDQQVRPGSLVLEASRSGSARDRRAAGKLRSGDPCHRPSDALAACTVKRARPSRRRWPTDERRLIASPQPVCIWLVCVCVCVMVRVRLSYIWCRREARSGSGDEATAKMQQQWSNWGVELWGYVGVRNHDDVRTGLGRSR